MITTAQRQSHTHRGFRALPIGVILLVVFSAIVALFHHVALAAPDEPIVSTVAGNGNAGYVYGPAADAEFYVPGGIAVDTAGNLYITDTGNYRIRKITPDGAVSTVAGNGNEGYVDGPAADAEFNILFGIAVDTNSSLFVADAGNNHICKITMP